MSGTRVALLIGCSDYEDPEFPQLSAPARDVSALKRVLANPSIGDFTVETVFNQPPAEVSEQVEGFFADRGPEDLVLLYFSCHGVLDSRGRLFFAATSTKRQRLEATGISARWVAEQMDHSRSQRIVLLLDCCYSGAFSGGLRRRSAGAEEISEQLKGRGRVVITASDKLEYAYGSEFTNAVVRGLETGAADLDGDGHVEVHELYQYVYDQVRQTSPDQTPTISKDRMSGRLYLAANPHAESPLPVNLQEALGSQEPWQRLWAIDGLRRLLAGDVPGGQKRTARRELLRLRDHDTDPDIQAVAGDAFRSVPTRPPPPAHRPLRGRHLAIGGLVVSMAAAGTAIAFSSQPPSSLPCSSSARQGNGVLSLGTLLPNDKGDFVYTGPALNAGVRLAMKEIGMAGRIPGITEVRLDPGNQKDEGKPSEDTASRSADELLCNEVDAIIGPATSAVGLKIIDKVTSAGVILFSPSNTSNVFTTYPDHGFYFRSSPPAAAEAVTLGKLIVDDGNSTVVVISRDDPYGNDLRDEVVAALRKSGKQVLDSFHYDPNASDYTKDIKRVKDKNPDAIVLIGFRESASILRGMIQQEIGPRDKRVYGANSNMNDFLGSQVNRRNPGVLAGMKGTVPYPGNENFVRALRADNPSLGTLSRAAQAYEAVIITTLAAAVAGTDEPNAIAKEINGVTKDGERCESFAKCLMLVKDHKNIAYVGPSGPLEFSDSGEPRSAPYVIAQILGDGSVSIPGDHVP